MNFLRTTKTPRPKSERYIILFILFVYCNPDSGLEFYQEMSIVYCNLLNNPSNQSFAVFRNLFQLIFQIVHHIRHALANTILVSFLQEQIFLFRSEFTNLISESIVVLLDIR